MARYEQALAGRFNQEALRSAILGDLGRARRGEFLDNAAPDPEPLPPGADAATRRRPGGGGVTERQPAKSGDSGPDVDLFKGKLAHMMVGWPPAMPAGDVFDAPTVEKTRAVPAGLRARADRARRTRDLARARQLHQDRRAVLRRAAALQGGTSRTRWRWHTDPAAALPLLEARRDEARALG